MCYLSVSEDGDSLSQLPLALISVIAIKRLHISILLLLDQTAVRHQLSPPGEEIVGIMSTKIHTPIMIHPPMQVPHACAKMFGYRVSATGWLLYHSSQLQTLSTPRVPPYIIPSSVPLLKDFPLRHLPHAVLVALFLEVMCKFSIGPRLHQHLLPLWLILWPILLCKSIPLLRNL